MQRHRGKVQKIIGAESSNLYLKMQMTEKQQEFRIIEQGNVFLRCIEKSVLFGTANGILQSLWS